MRLRMARTEEVGAEPLAANIAAAAAEREGRTFANAAATLPAPSDGAV